MIPGDAESDLISAIGPDFQHNMAEADPQASLDVPDCDEICIGGQVWADDIGHDGHT
jgi:hypothetical protein